MNSMPDTTTFQPTYMAYATFEGILDQLKANGIPDLIDRSVLSNKSGGDQSQFLRAAENFKLIDSEKAPTERMRQLVHAEDRGPLLGEILRESYPGVVALGTGATSAMLEEEFRKFGIEGETVRKAITFYLNAARQTDIELSPHFKATRPGAGGRRTAGARRRTKSTTGSQNDQQTPPPANPLSSLHPAIKTLVQELPPFQEDGKPVFSAAQRKAWFAYAEATFNLIYALPEDDAGAGEDDV